MVLKYNINQSRGDYLETIRFRNETADSLYETLTKVFPKVLKEHKIDDVVINELEVKSGGFFGSTCKGLLLSHPSRAYFDLSIICVNDGSLMFKILGKSAEQYKLNMHEALTKEGHYIKAAMYRPDTFLIQEENSWDAKICEAIQSMMID